MKILIFSFLFLIFLSSIGAAQKSEINIIPQPKSLQKLQGEFKLNYKTKIIANDDVSRNSAGILNDLLMKNYGFKLEYVSNRKTPKGNAIVFTSKGFPMDKFSDEGYGLTVAPTNIQIFGSDKAQFYAIQSLMQLLPVEFKGEAAIPAVDISDEPRFKYRGMHLDVSRHFMPVSFVKKYVDLMAQYKFNQFHWHLTDDQGWRIEIKKYPKLTEIGSKRKESHEGRYSPCSKATVVQSKGFTRRKKSKMSWLTQKPEK